MKILTIRLSHLNWFRVDYKAWISALKEETTVIWRTINECLVY